MILVLFSENRKEISWRLVLSGLILQLLLAFLILGVPFLSVDGLGNNFFKAINQGFISLTEFSEYGSNFLFGSLLDTERNGYIIAFKVLPTIVFFSSLMALLYHLKILPLIVFIFAKVFSLLMRVTGVEALAASANIFVGQTEAPLIVKPFLKSMTRSELFCLMVGGMATVAGGVMAAYIGLLKESIPSIGGHLLTASILSAPAAFVCAKILIPETEEAETLNHVPKKFLKSPYINLIDACSQGTIDGLKLALNVGAMLLTFISIMALFDYSMGELSLLFSFDEWGKNLVHPSLYSEGVAKLNFSVLFSWLFYPFSLLLGIHADEAWLASSLLAKKLILNEFVAYVELAKSAPELSERTNIILSYALCGFANFSSIGIQIGGIGSLEESKKRSLAELGLRSLLGGTLAAYMTACLAGLLI